MLLFCVRFPPTVRLEEFGHDEESKLLISVQTKSISLL